MIKIVFSLILLSLFFITGCSSKKQVIIEKKELPSWYLHPKKSTNYTLYAVGEGEDKNMAIYSALDAMVATLGITISSQYSSEIVAKDGFIDSYQATSEKKINAKVQEIHISSYEIINAQKFGFRRYFVEIKSDKQKLFSSLEKELKYNFKTIQKIYTKNEKSDILRKLKLYKDVTNLTKSIKNILVVMNGLKPTFDDSIYLNKLQMLNGRYENLHSKISFSIDSNNDASNLKNIVANGLNVAKYKIDNLDGKNHFKIYISSKINKIKSYGFYLARSSIYIEVRDFKESVISSNTLNITTQSAQNYERAKENLVIKFSNIVKKQGIIKVLGLKID